MSEARMVPSRPAPGEDWSRGDPTLDVLLAQHLDEGEREALAPLLGALGREAPERLDAWARTADRERPRLLRRSPEGERVDEVRFHPAYGSLQDAARRHRVFTLSWHPFAGPRPAPRVATFALGYLYAQAESGYYCPACMTDGAAFVMTRHAPPELAKRFVPRLVSLDSPDGWEGAMYLTEKGGGSDVGGATRTTARRDADGTWRLSGEKWFASNCTADVALALARTSDELGSKGLALFAVPRRLPDGTPNRGVAIERLKDKLGVASMPTGEVVLSDAHAWLVAPAPGGFHAMMEMVNLSRLYNAVASVAVARRALREARRAGRTREAFGVLLRDHPLFARGLATLTVDVEAALAFVLDTAAAFDAWAGGARDEPRHDRHQAGMGAGGPGNLLRLLTPCAKAVTARLAVRAASEACEALGGNGYIEEYVTPRLLRDAQVLPIWEGTTNIQALEFLRALGRPGAGDALAARVAATLEAARAPSVAPVVVAVREALAAWIEEVAGLGERPRARQELAAISLLEAAYAMHAAALLARAACHPEATPRLGIVANLHAALRVPAGDHPQGARLDDALEEALREGGPPLIDPDAISIP